MRSSKINRTRLRTAVLILFLLQTLMLPAAIGVTYASRSLKPEHILTYSAGRLVWDAGTDTDSSGAARLRLFDTAYSHVDSGDGAEVVGCTPCRTAAAAPRRCCRYPLPRPIPASRRYK